MSALVEAIHGVARDPASIQARARLAIVLEKMGTLEASRVWAAAVRLASSRGQFFPAFFLCRLHIPHKALQTQLLVELANRFGSDRIRTGMSAPPPIVPAIEVKIPSQLDRQLYLAVKLGTQIQGLGLPEGAEVPEIPMFGALPTAEFVAFSLLLENVMLEPGQVFIEQDSLEQSIYLLGNGNVRVSKRNPDGSSSILAEIRAPAVIGEMSLLTAVPRRASVMAVDKGVAWRVDGIALSQLAQAHPELTGQLNLIVKRRLLDNLIHSSVLFREAGPNVDDLLHALQVVHISPGTRVFDQGAPPPGLFIVLHGEAEVWNSTAEGDNVRLAVLDEGDAFGEMSLLTGKKTTASVWMPQGGVLLHLSNESYLHIRDAMPSLEVQLTEMMVIRRSELQSVATPIHSYEEIDLEDSSWMTGDFPSFP